MTIQKIAIGLVAVALFAGVVTVHAADFDCTLTTRLELV